MTRLEDRQILLLTSRKPAPRRAASPGLCSGRDRPAHAAALEDR